MPGLSSWMDLGRGKITQNGSATRVCLEKTNGLVGQKNPTVYLWFVRLTYNIPPDLLEQKTPQRPLMLK